MIRASSFSVRFFLFFACVTGSLWAPAIVASEVTTPVALTFAERVSCVEKVEDAYWNYRIWPDSNPGVKPPRATFVSRQQIADHVESTLLYEAALEERWEETLTQEQIQAELERIAVNTQHPNLLRDVFAALDNDPYLVAECFVRPRLAERRARNRFARDTEIHRAVREQAEAALLGAPSVEDLENLDVHVSEQTWRFDSGVHSRGHEAVAGGVQRVLAPVEWYQMTGRVVRLFDDRPESIGDDDPAVVAGMLSSLVGRGFSTLIDENHGFTAVIVLESGDDHLRLASATWPKRSFGDWMGSIKRGLRPAEPELGMYTLPPVPTKSQCLDDTWEPTSTTGTPPDRFAFSTVWTGTEMIIWGGNLWGTDTNTGGRYDLAADSWTSTTTAGAPTARSYHTGVWTGTEVVVWGGYDYPTYYNTGGRYNPSTNTWSATSTASAASARSHHTAVWSGTEMIVWGGNDYSAHLNTGGRYNPTSNTWLATTTTNAPSARRNHTSVWTGSEMVTWGGNLGAPNYSDGGRYSPSTDSWVPTSLTGAPDARRDHTAIWSGSEMIVWGGIGGSWFDSGGRYDPTSDSWIPTSTNGAPSPRYSHSAIWTGTEMIIWGGGTNSVPENTGGRYDPSGDIWVSTSTTSAPVPRLDHAAAWGGATPKMIVALGGDTSGPLQSGGLYCASGVVPYDFGDAPDPTYPTLEASDGARHRGGSSLFLGTTLDYDDDGQPSANADGDDNDGTDDEDGVVFTSIASPGGTANVDVEASEAGLLNAWVDFNTDGDWDDTGEQIFIDEALAAGINSLTFSVPAGATVGVATVARFRVDSTGGLLPTGAASDGEVEDHLITVEEFDFGDAIDPTYPTLLASDGARHRVGGTLFMGATIDADPDGQPSNQADGDDTDPQGDDEDGVVFTTPVVPGGTATVEVEVTEACLLNAWIDFNRDYDWDDPGEQIFADEPLVAGVNSMNFPVPSVDIQGIYTTSRFRVDSGGGLLPSGEASDGEVEDHRVFIKDLDYGDAPDPTYPTLLASNGARHVADGTLYLGFMRDPDLDGQPNSTATGDDNDGSDDEDGVTFNSPFAPGAQVSVDVRVSAPGLLNAWVDFNADGDWADAGEQVFTDEAVVTGVNPLLIAVPAGTSVGSSFARFRVDTAGGLSFDGEAPDGEVEDYMIVVEELDYGDAPDPTYPTLVASSGAGHILGSGLFLGASVDAELDGQPSANADGDDLDGNDDEDGVVFTSGVGRGLDASIEVTASAAGLLNAWADFNADGDWSDAGEQFFTDQPLAAGVNPLSFAVPPGATVGNTFVRFRVDSVGGLSFDGVAADGEVEDYEIEIVEGPDLSIEMVASSDPTPSGDPLSYTITVTNNGPLDATSVTLTDTLPAELIFVSSTPSSPDCTFSVDTLTCDLGTLSPSGTAQVVIETMLDHPVWGSFSNTASVAAAELDPIPGNNTTTAHTTIAVFVDGFESGDAGAWAATAP